MWQYNNLLRILKKEDGKNFLTVTKMTRNNAKRLLLDSSHWLLVFVVFVLLYSGLTDSIWPIIIDFRHSGWNVPAACDTVAKMILAPLIAGGLIGISLRRELSSAWMMLVNPIVYVFLLGIASDSFYPPWRAESLSRLFSGLVLGIFAWLGWFLCILTQRAREQVL